MFEQHFIAAPQAWSLSGYDLHTEAGQVSAEFVLEQSNTLKGTGNGIVDALCNALSQRYNAELEIIQFDEHSLSQGTTAQAQASVAITINNTAYSAVAVAADTSAAALQAVLTAFSQSNAAQMKGAA